ncbi:MAG: hypothetical protein HQL37_02795 [Alphaproteobacteria bacterium]|nr:hypothetical protein [Alphaproteobacteria bacterium]
MVSEKLADVSADGRDVGITVAVLRYTARDIRTAAQEAPKCGEMLQNLADLMEDLASSVLDATVQAMPTRMSATIHQLRRP